MLLCGRSARSACGQLVRATARWRVRLRASPLAQNRLCIANRKNVREYRDARAVRQRSVLAFVELGDLVQRHLRFVGQDRHGPVPDGPTLRRSGHGCVCTGGGHKGQRLVPGHAVRQHTQPAGCGWLRCNCLNWCAHAGHPIGEISRLLALLPKIDHNGLSDLLKPLRHGRP